MKNKLQAIALVADHKDFRPALNVVRFDDKNIVATDGFILAMTENNTDQRKNIQALELAKMKKSDTLEGTSKIVNGSTATQLQEIEIENYPSYERIIPENDQYIGSVSLGLPVLKKLIKSLEKSGAEAVEISIQSDPLESVKVETYGINPSNKDEKITYIVMPYKTK